MKANQIQNVIANITKDPVGVKMVIICRDGDFEILGHDFNVDTVIGQLRRLEHNLLSNYSEEPTGVIRFNDRLSDPPKTGPGTSFGNKEPIH